MGYYVRIATTEEIPPGFSKAVVICGTEIAVFNVAGKYYAISNTCPHEGGPLAEGTVDLDVVMCPWHAYDFNLTTGECALDPKLRVRTYTIQVEGDEIRVEIMPDGREE